MPAKHTLPERKRNRLPFFDYSENGGYFVTVCTQNRVCILSQITSDPPAVRLTPYGEAVSEAIGTIPLKYRGVYVENSVIMPNHVHILLRIDNAANQSDLSEIVIQFKRAVTIRIGKSVWQKGFYDHVIRNVDDFNVKYVYIDNNPANWLLRRDEYFV